MCISIPYLMSKYKKKEQAKNSEDMSETGPRLVQKEDKDSTPNSTFRTDRDGSQSRDRRG